MITSKKISQDATKKSTLPSLSSCISTIKTFSLAGEGSIEIQADGYSSMLAFLCHLKNDQATLFGAADGTLARDDDMDSTLFNNIPAINSVLEDSDLFIKIIKMLSYDIPPSSSNATQSSVISSISFPKNQGSSSTMNIKKRKINSSSSLNSENDAASNKQFKHRHTASVNEQVKIAPSTVSSASSEKYKNPSADFSLRVFAATALFTSLRHLDHWPAPLMKYYAEDCLGSRLWVDDARCSMLAKNIALALDSEILEESDPDLLESSSVVAELYSSFNENKSEEEEHLLAPFAALGNEISYPPSLDERSVVDKLKGSTHGSASDEIIIEEIPIVSKTKKAESSAASALMEMTLTKKAPSLDIKDGQSYEDVSSSSGEEDIEEEVVLEDIGLGSGSLKPSDSLKDQGENSIVDTNTTVSEKSFDLFQSTKLNISPSMIQKVWFQKILDLTRIRPRFVGANKKLAFTFVVSALSERLNSKSKQNSRLIAAIPHFASIPKVRSLSAEYLGKWLQSPALSGLGRTLFSKIVSNMKNIDPPLQEDIDAINSILSMKLKANQLTAHIDNITSIAIMIPTISISRHLFIYLLHEELADIEDNKKSTISTNTQTSDLLRMFTAVYNVLPLSLVLDALASAILNVSNNSETDLAKSKKQRKVRTQALCILLQRISLALGNLYNGRLLIERLLKFHDDSCGSCPIDDYEGIARLVFECALYIVPLTNTQTNSQRMTKGQKKLFSSSNSQEVSSDSITSEVKKDLFLTRKVLLKWCATSFASVFYSDVLAEEKLKLGSENQIGSSLTKGHKEAKVNHLDASIIGAGLPVYSSALDGHTSQLLSESNSAKKSNYLLKTICCLLFMADPESSDLAYFLSGGTRSSYDSNLMTKDQYHRIAMCHSYGTDFDDEMLRIILEAAKKSITPSLALSLIENMFLLCKVGSTSKLCLQDSELIWDMYDTLALCEISSKSVSGSLNKNTESGSKPAAKLESDGKEVASNSDNMMVEMTRIAYPGRWWRVTAVSLVICGLSPQDVGSSMWKKHPTLQCLMKMMISGRYRFPTADCDNEKKEEMKSVDYNLREMENKIAEKLFMPKQESKSIVPKKRFSRTSLRQKAKREKEDTMATQLDTQRLKKMLRIAQRSIMILEPRLGARKPPKESVQIFLSVDELFGVSSSLRQCTSPDFLMLTLGGTSRDSIERAYDWLIPIISSHPFIIKRLSSSASCILLLRAYGAHGEKDNFQLIELSAPLLEHVRNCLGGKFGEKDAVEAAELLFTDIADRDADRRKCARRALQEAIGSGSMNHTLFLRETELHTTCSWLKNLFSLKFATLITILSIKCLTNALSYERGEVLRSYILALQALIHFAKENNLCGNFDFVSILSNLLYARPHVCAAAFDRFVDLRDLAINSIYEKWLQHLSDDVTFNMNGNESSDFMAKVFVICQVTSNDNVKEVKKEISVPLSLLHAALVLLGNWNDEEETLDVSVSEKDEEPKCVAVRNLARFLITKPTSKVDDESMIPGAAGAVLKENNERAISVDQWVLLAKSRCAFIARNAALSAPTKFLPRLLLCCGLPQSSLFTMIDRLGKLGDSSDDQNKAFKELLSLSATSEWASGFLGNRKAVARKLLGRISAYLEIHKNGFEQRMCNKLSTSFVQWLSDECSNIRPICASSLEKTKKGRIKKGTNTGSAAKSKASVPDYLANINLATAELHRLIEEPKHHEIDMLKDNLPIFYPPTEEISDNLSLQETSFSYETDEIIMSKSFVERCLSDANLQILENEFRKIISSKLKSCSISKENGGDDQIEYATLILSTYIDLGNSSYRHRAFAMKWIPTLTSFSGSVQFWTLLFSSQSESNSFLLDLLLSSCGVIWSREHIKSCQNWIVSEGCQDFGSSCYSFPRMLRFLLKTSEQLSVHATSLGKHQTEATFIFAQSQDIANSVISLALHCATSKACSNKSDESVNIDDDDAIKDETQIVTESRNEIPDWLRLLLLVARCGGKCCNLVSKRLLDHFLEHKECVFSCALLRIYTYYPSLISLGDMKVRKVLLDAASEYAKPWLDWRCPIDGQLQEMIVSISKTPQQRLTLELSNASKQYPLLVVRKLMLMTSILNDDASIAHSRNHSSEKRGRIHGANKKTFAIAMIDQSTVRVKVRHWGYCFTESVWLSFLEAITCMSSEVLYSHCAFNLGLIELLNVCLKLVVCQKKIQAETNTYRLKIKLASILSSFKANNMKSWETWSNSCISGIEGWGIVHELIKLCEINVEVA